MFAKPAVKEIVRRYKLDQHQPSQKRKNHIRPVIKCPPTPGRDINWDEVRKRKATDGTLSKLRAAYEAKKLTAAVRDIMDLPLPPWATLESKHIKNGTKTRRGGRPRKKTKFRKKEHPGQEGSKTGKAERNGASEGKKKE